MKNLDFKMRERFHRREHDEDSQQQIEMRKLAKTKSYSSDCDIAKYIESCEDCGFCEVRDTNARDS